MSATAPWYWRNICRPIFVVGAGRKSGLALKKNQAMIPNPDKVIEILATS
jgi:hypothetical protein